MDDRIRELATNVLIQAVKDYLRSSKEAQKNVVLKDLRSPWMDFLTEGRSIILAEKLVSNPEGIKKILNIK